MRKIALCLLMFVLAIPGWASKRVTIAELDQFLATSKGKSDTDLAWQLGDMQLTERLTAARFIQLKNELTGEASIKALVALDDESQFQNLPAAETPAVTGPAIPEQRRIMGLVAGYVGKTIPQLPNFFASRQTLNFEDTPQYNAASGMLVRYEPMHPVNQENATVLYRDKHEVAEAVGAKGKRPQLLVHGLQTWGIFGPILGTVLVDAAQSKLAWSHWENGNVGQEAVFSYSVSKEKSHYEVNFCCVADESAVVSANVRNFREIVGYHGEMAVDPTTGTILRLKLEADLKPTDPVVRAAILVEYGPVEIGGVQYFCPVKSISSTTSQTLQVDARYKFALANQMQPLKNSLSDIAFDQYHIFRADAKVLTEQEAEMAAMTAPTAPTAPTAAGSSETVAAADNRNPEAQTPEASKQGEAMAAEAVPPPAPAPVVGEPEISVEVATSLPDTPQLASSGDFTLKTTSRLVDVGLLAYDKKGHPVTDLKATDFMIFDNSEQQPVRFFGAPGSIAAPAPEERPATNAVATSAEPVVYSNRKAENAAANASTGNSTILMIDAANVAWSDLSYAREEMLRFAKTLPADESVGLYILKSYEFQVLLEPTADHAKLTQLLSRWMPTAQDLSRAQEAEGRNRQHIDWVAHESDLAFVNGNDGLNPEGNTSGSGVAEQNKHGVDPQLRKMGANPERDVLANLQAVARHLGSLKGHKALVWVSSDNVLADWSGQAAGREDEGVNPLESATLAVREALNESHASLYPLDVSQLEAGGISADLQNRLVQVKVPSLADPTPPPPPNPTGRMAAEMHQDTHAIQAVFRDLAEATGGRALRRAGEIAHELNGIVADARSTYLLSFTPDVPADDKYHQITVKVAGRTDLKLRYRTGYLYSKKGTTLKERFQQAIWKQEDASQIGLTAATDGNGVKLTVAANDVNLAENDGRRTGKLDIFLVQRDEAGWNAKATGQRVSLKLQAATFEKAQVEGLTFEQHLDSKLEKGSLRVMVVDEITGRIGSVTIPAKALSGTR